MAARDLNHEAAEALRQAMRLLGTEGNKANFVRLLKAAVGDGPGETTVGSWLREDAPIPAWALIAAARVAQTSLDALVEHQEFDDRMTRFERELGELKRQLASEPGHAPTD